ncbi:MAG: SDR family NAD(P)-dependent oxidoreductase [Rhodoferax sp.]
MTTSKSPFILEHRIALVTGGGTGLGAAISRGLATHGAKVVIVGPEIGQINETVSAIENIGGKAWGFELDVRDRVAAKTLADRIAKEIGDVSILINNAGIIRYATMEEPTVHAAWDDVVDVNLTGPFNVTNAFQEQLKKTRGAVVNLSSIAATMYTNNTVAYSASKGGVRSLTLAMARELGKYGVRVNAIAPGVMNTSMAPSAAVPERRAVIENRVALGRIGEPADMVGPVVFLVSPMAEYVTGHTLLVDGGYTTA